MSKHENDFLPNYVVSPGEILEEYLESCGMTQAELSERTGLAKKTINEIVKGKAPVSAETALKFERVFSRPAKFWLNLEFNYQEDKSRIAEQKKLSTELEWLKKIPVKEMVNLGWIEGSKDKLRQLEVGECSKKNVISKTKLHPPVFHLHETLQIVPRSNQPSLSYAKPYTFYA